MSQTTTTEQISTDTATGAIRPLRPGWPQRFIEHLAEQSADQATADARALTDALLRDALEAKASDIHLDPYSDAARVRFRVDGWLMDVSVTSHEQHRRLVNGLKTMAELDPVATFHPQDAHHSYEIEGNEIDLRISTTPCAAGEKVTIRLLDPAAATRRLSELGLSDSAHRQVESWLDQAAGMFLVAGPTGSGKTTTLYALLHQLKSREGSVITIEDPVEYQIEGLTQIPVDHTHRLTFAEGIKAMLRHDPDYLMVGEVRDEPSAEASVSAAITGKVLLATLHARDAVSLITALRNYGVKDHQIAATLAVVMAQRLVRRLCPDCAAQDVPGETEVRWLKALGRDAPALTYHAKGCDACRGLGYRGRIGIFELWQLTDDDLQQILDHANERQLRANLSRRSHRSLIDEGLAKVEAGTTTIHELRQAIGMAALPELG